MANKNVFNILFLSNMMKEKGVYTLLNACALLKNRNLQFCCHFVGKWSDITERAFNDYIRELKIRDSVVAYGAKYGDDKIVYFKQADVIVFPTFYHNECFPVVLLEAMEQGLACISSCEGGIPSIIDDGITGYIVEKKNPEALAEKIELLMSNPALCKSMGEAGRKKFLRQFTLDKFENRMKDILLECLR